MSTLISSPVAVITFDADDLAGQARAAYIEFQRQAAAYTDVANAYHAAEAKLGQARRVLMGLTQALDATLDPRGPCPFTIADLYDFDDPDQPNFPALWQRAHAEG